MKNLFTCTSKNTFQTLLKKFSCVIWRQYNIALYLHNR